MLRRKRLLAYILVALYLVTWVGGWISYTRHVRDETEARWQKGVQRSNDLEADFAKMGDELPIFHRVFTEGPHRYVHWCLPVLPGILLTDSGYSIGPHMGRGGNYLVLYYGFGCVELWWLGGWIS